MKAVIHGICPSKSNSYRIGNNTLFKTEALRKYESSFFIQCPLRGKMIDRYFELYVDVYYPNQRSDLDGAFKIILDCLQACKVIKNDNKLVMLKARKFLDKDKPRIEFEIKEV